MVELGNIKESFSVFVGEEKHKAGDVDENTRLLVSVTTSGDGIVNVRATIYEGLTTEKVIVRELCFDQEGVFYKKWAETGLGKRSYRVHIKERPAKIEELEDFNQALTKASGIIAS